MTGEVTLTGRVLPVGGVREKILAARRAGIKTVLIPRHNEKDLVELPAEVKADLTFRLVDTLDDVVPRLFEADRSRQARRASPTRCKAKPSPRSAAKPSSDDRKAARSPNSDSGESSTERCRGRRARTLEPAISTLARGSAVSSIWLDGHRDFAYALPRSSAGCGPAADFHGRNGRGRHENRASAAGPADRPRGAWLVRHLGTHASTTISGTRTRRSIPRSPGDRASATSTRSSTRSCSSRPTTGPGRRCTS